MLFRSHSSETISTNVNTERREKYTRCIFRINKNVINNKRHLQFVNFHFAGQEAKILDHQVNTRHSEAGLRRKAFLFCFVGAGFLGMFLRAEPVNKVWHKELKNWWLLIIKLQGRKREKVYPKKVE